jgi:Protein of unknown function, DUF488
MSISPNRHGPLAVRAFDVEITRFRSAPMRPDCAFVGWSHGENLFHHRPLDQDDRRSRNAYWRVRSFRNYADYALTAPFAAGMARLQERGSGHRCAIMCAEAVWWRCHRRIIADYLLAAGERVMHILGTSHVDEAHLTPGAVLRNDGTVVYPAESPRPG